MVGSLLVEAGSPAGGAGSLRGEAGSPAGEVGSLLVEADSLSEEAGLLLGRAGWPRSAGGWRCSHSRIECRCSKSRSCQSRLSVRDGWNEVMRCQAQIVQQHSNTLSNAAAQRQSRGP